MAISPQLSVPFDIQKVVVKVAGEIIDHLAGPEIGGMNRIIPMPTGNEPPMLDARGDPVGRVMPRKLKGQVAMVMVSVMTNSPSAEKMMNRVNAPGGDGMGITVAIASEDSSGSAIETMSVDNVVFSCAPLDYDSGAQAMVFQGIGWNLSYTTRTPTTG